MRSPGQKPSHRVGNPDHERINPATDLPDPSDGADEDSELDDFDPSFTDADDPRWDVFIPDDDQCDPLPDLNDFGGSRELGARSMEPD
jgi:hypothetical protein